MSGLRAIDHLVLAVGDLATARSRLTALGFTVAPDARHPFGTENACVFFGDDTYLEPLAIASEADSVVSARQGNVFTARDRAFRFRHGPEGLEAVVFQSLDALADHRSFVGAGQSAGEMLTFSRAFTMPDGTSSEASFKLAFASDLRSPDFYTFTCQRVNPPKVDRSSLTAHQNGVAGLAGVVLCEPVPGDFTGYLTEISGGASAGTAEGGINVATENAALSVLTPDEFKLQFGYGHCCHARGLRARAVRFHVGSLQQAEALFRRNGVVHERIGGRLVVRHAPGQGVLYSFEEKA
jgi:hypothetical protein